MKYNNIADLISMAESKKTMISEIIIQNEVKVSGNPRQYIIKKMMLRLKVMKESVNKGLQKDNKSASGLVGDNARKLNQHKNVFFSTGIYHRVTSYALAVAEVNASMGQIVACPTAGSSGIIPATVLALGQEQQLNDEELSYGLFTAAGIGEVVSKKATLAGAEGGCQAECGVAAAMAAGAVTELCQGTPAMVGNAFALALKNMLGLVCDPVAGLVEVPCVKRNGFAAAHAITAANMALSGIESIISPDEVIEAMDEIGKLLPYSLKETSQAGLAHTVTGKKIADRLKG